MGISSSTSTSSTYDTSARRISRLLLASSFATALLACGGGGDDGGPPPPVSPPVSPPVTPPPGPSFNERISGASYDYDNNGTADAIDTLEYDAQGRVLTQTYVYTADGVADRVSGAGNVSFINDNTYDAAGRMSTLVTRYTSGVNAGTASITRLQYDATGLLARADIFDRDRAGAESMSVSYTYAYAAGLRSEAVTVIGGTPLMRQTFTYNADGLPVVSSMEHLLSPSVRLPRTEYEWNADRTLSAERYDTNRDGVFERVSSYEYTGGRLTRIAKAHGGAYASQPSEIYALNYDSAGRLQRIDTDAGANGSIDATRAASYQAGICRPVTLTLLLPLVSADGFNTSADGSINFCGP